MDWIFCRWEAEENVHTRRRAGCPRRRTQQPSSWGPAQTLLVDRTSILLVSTSLLRVTAASRTAALQGGGAGRQTSDEPHAKRKYSQKIREKIRVGRAMAYRGLAPTG